MKPKNKNIQRSVKIDSDYNDFKSSLDSITNKPNWNLYRKSYSAHVFIELDKELKLFLPFIDIIDRKNYPKFNFSYLNKEILIKELSLPYKGSDIYNIFILVFNSIFNFNISPISDFNWDIYIVVLSDHHQKKIEQIIERFDLANFADVIYYLICKTQELYMETRYINTLPKREIKKLDDELTKLIDIIKLKYYPKRTGNKLDNPPEISSVDFKLPMKISINDPYVIDIILLSVLEKYKRLGLGNWELAIRSLNKIYENKLHVKEKLSCALHEFFIRSNTFKHKGRNLRGDQQMLCIAEMLELGLFKISPKVDDNRRKIKNIRNFLDRNCND